MKFEFKSFNELSTDELYDILRLRSEIFVVEQTCVYNDLDGKFLWLNKTVYIMIWMGWIKRQFICFIKRRVKLLHTRDC